MLANDCRFRCGAAGVYLAPPGPMVRLQPIAFPLPQLSLTPAAGRVMGRSAGAAVAMVTSLAAGILAKAAGRPALQAWQDGAGQGRPGLAQHRVPG